MKIATFKNIAHNYVTIADEDYGAHLVKEKHLRTSEWVEVEFPPLAREEAVRAELAALNAARAEVVEKFSKMLHEIDDRRNSLLALSNESAAS